MTSKNPMNSTTPCRPLAFTCIVSLVVLTVTLNTARAQSPQRSEKRVIPQLLADNQAVIGIFARAKTPEGGAERGSLREADFVFYSLETGPFDLDTMKAYIEGMAKGAGDYDPPPLALRTPPIGDEENATVKKIKAGVEAGANIIVIPHVRNAREAAVAVEAMGDQLYPGNKNGSLITMLIVEDVEGVGNVKEIVKTPGVSVVFAGPGDLRRAYRRDMEAVEKAIQTILAACKEAGVPAGITANSGDIAERLKQGFSVIIVQQPDTLTVGRKAAGRK